MSWIAHPRTYKVRLMTRREDEDTQHEEWALDGNSLHGKARPDQDGYKKERSHHDCEIGPAFPPQLSRKDCVVIQRVVLPW